MFGWIEQASSRCRMQIYLLVSFNLDSLNNWSIYANWVAILINGFHSNPWTLIYCEKFQARGYNLLWGDYKLPFFFERIGLLESGSGAPLCPLIRRRRRRRRAATISYEWLIPQPQQSPIQQRCVKGISEHLPPARVRQFRSTIALQIKWLRRSPRCRALSAVCGLFFLGGLRDLKLKSILGRHVKGQLSFVKACIYLSTWNEHL